MNNITFYFIIRLY